MSRILRHMSGRMTSVDEGVHAKLEGDKGMKNNAKFLAGVTEYRIISFTEIISILGDLGTR